MHINDYIFFLISNKDSLISKRERNPSTPGVYRGEQIKNEHYKNQENPKYIEEEGWFLHTENQSSRVLKKVA